LDSATETGSCSLVAFRSAIIGKDGQGELGSGFSGGGGHDYTFLKNGQIYQDIELARSQSMASGRTPLL